VGQGALLAFRQDSEAESSIIALRDVPPGRRFDLFRAPGEDPASTVGSAELSRGIPVRLTSKRSTEVFLIREAR
jgi:hypothetical protein